MLMYITLPWFDTVCIKQVYKKLFYQKLNCLNIYLLFLKIVNFQVFLFTMQCLYNKKVNYDIVRVYDGGDI